MISHLITQLMPFVELFAGLAVFAGGLGYSYEKFSGGRNEKKGEASQQTKENTVLIEDLTARIDALTKEMERRDAEHTREREQWHIERGELLQKLGQLEGAMKEKDGKLSEYKEFFERADPKLNNFLERLIPILERLEKRVL